MFLNWKPFNVFYGWWIVAASFFIALYVGGAFFYGFTAVFEPITNEFGWSYTQVSLAASLRGLEVSLLAPFLGVLVDRWGPRRLIFSGVVISVAGLFLLSFTTSLGMFYGAFILIAIGIGACSMTVLLTAVANWFRRKVGIASGIVVSGFGSGGLLIPVIVRLIEVYEWRMALVVLALSALVLILPLSLLFRHKPEQYGYVPDGQEEVAMIFDNRLVRSQAVEVNVKAAQAIKSSTFWHVVLAFTCHVMAVSATVTHIMPYLSTIGIARSKSSLVATVLPLMSVIGRFSFGWLGDKLDRKWLATGTFAMMSLGLLCFGYTATAGTWLLVPFLILFGIGYGGSTVMRAALAREYFGRANFGAIFGLVMGLNSLGSIIGPPLAGWVYDNWGSYQGIWFIFAGLAVTALVSIFTIRPVRSTVELADKS